MATGTTGPERPGLNVHVTNGFGPMTTGSFLQIGEDDLRRSKDGWVALDACPRREEIRRAVEQASLAGRSISARRELQKHLLVRGMTPYLPDSVAVLLADPIFHKRWNTAEGLKLRRHVDVTTVDLDALGKAAGSRLMFSAFQRALKKSTRLLLPGDYTALVADVFMADPEMAVVWHLMGSGFKTRAQKEQLDKPESYTLSTLEELEPQIGNLTSVVGKAQLLQPKRKLQWRVHLSDVVPEVVGSTASFDESLLAAMNHLQRKDQIPTFVGVLDVAAQVFKNGVDSLGSGGNGKSLADLEVTPMFKPSDYDPMAPLKVRI